VKGSGFEFTGATVVEALTTESEIRVVDVVAPSAVSLVITVEVVVLVATVDEFVSGAGEVVVVVVVGPGGGGGGAAVVVVLDVDEVPSGMLDVVVGAEELVVVVEAAGVPQPLSKTAIPVDVQFLPPYVSPGPKSNGGMMSPHFVCLGMAAKKTGPLWPSCPW
jgi:hypothetical protein